jgi:hypothetical protein
MVAPACPVDSPQFPAEDYAYLLGIYLGDGHLVRFPRDVYKLTIACDAGYPGLIDAAARAVKAVLPTNRVTLIRHPVDRCTRVQCYSKRMPSLFPQHGPGRKHERRIVLSTWQADITEGHAEAFVRGLMHSDGSRFVARQRVGIKTYEYVRYAFANRSEDIKAILCRHLDLLDIGWTRPNAKLIAIDRRAEVAKLDAFIGPKH